uniref:Putative secreted protein n=1 Tax=Xenopsylla cheopis TaxID=163159 RepID=A0A6M2DV09_XENCH
MTIPQLSISFFRFSSLSALCGVHSTYICGVHSTYRISEVPFLYYLLPSIRRSERERSLSPVYFTQGLHTT